MPTAEISDRELRLWRLRSQRLLPGSEVKTVAAAASKALAIQAQDVGAALLAIRARTTGMTAARARAAAARKPVCRSWLMRNTIFLFASKELAWLRPLLRPRPMAQAENRLAQLGGLEAAEALIAELPSILAKGPLPRSELREMLKARGVTESGVFYWTPHLAALRGVLVTRPALDNVHTFAAAPPDEPVGREAGLARLGRRFLQAHGPATAEDLAYWAKMPLGEARAAFESAGRTVTLATERGELTALAANADPPAVGKRPLVRLLGWWDHYLLSWKGGRDLTVPPSGERLADYRAGMIAPTAFADGLAFAAWRLEQEGDLLTVVVEPFERLPNGVRPGLEAEAADLGRFFEADAVLRVEPGARRTARPDTARRARTGKR